MKTFLQRNLGLKLFSLVLAYGTWAMLAQLPKGHLAVKAPVVPVVGEGVVAVSVEPREVQLRVTADEIALRRMSAEAVYAELDLTAMREGTVTVPVQPSDVRNLPSGTVEVQVLDGEVQVVLERLKKDRKPVEVQTTGEPARGFSVGTIAAAPTDVEVIGPRSAVTDLEMVRTQFVDLTGRRASFGTEVKLLSPGPNMSVSPEQVRVDVEIVEIPTEQEIALPVQTGSPLWRCEPDEVTVLLKAPPSRIGEIRSALTPVVVPAESVGPSGGKAKVEVDLSRLPLELQGQVEVQEIRPPAVRVRAVREGGGRR